MLWAMASNGETAEVVENDNIENKLLLVTSLDGTLPTVAKMCSTRVVCWNTVQCALKESGKQERVSRRSIFDATQIKRALGVASESFAAFIAQAKKLASQKIETEQAREVLRQIFGAPVSGKRAGVEVTGNATIDALLAAGAVKEQKSVARCLQLFAGAGMGAGLDGVQGTRWGLLNAVTQHIDHEQGRSDDNRLTSAWFGRGEDFKNSALELLTA
jgi:phage/plasmid-like protein (TIGR03299 family)